MHPPLQIFIVYSCLLATVENYIFDSFFAMYIIKNFLKGSNEYEGEV